MQCNHLAGYFMQRNILFISCLTPTSLLELWMYYTVYVHLFSKGILRRADFISPYVGGPFDWGRYVGGPFDWGRYVGGPFDWGRYVGGPFVWGRYVWGPFVGAVLTGPF